MVFKSSAEPRGRMAISQFESLNLSKNNVRRLELVVRRKLIFMSDKVEKENPVVLICGKNS
jgi:hypothetical protein